MKFWDERLRYLTQYVLAFKKRFLLTFCLSLIASGTLVLANYSLTLLIEKGFTGIHQWNRSPFFLFLIAFILLKWIGALLTYLSRRFSVETASQVTYAMQMNLYRHVFRLPLAFFDSTPSGKIVSRITHDIGKLRSLYETVLVRLTHATLLILMSYALLLYRNWIMALFCILPLVALGLITRFYVKRTAPMHKEISTSRSRLTNQFQEQIKNREIIQAFGKEEDALLAYEKESQAFSHLRTQMIGYESFANYTLNEAVTQMTKIIVLAGVGWMALHKLDPSLVATLFLFFTSMEEILTAFNRITQNIQVLNESIVAAGQICEILNQPEQVGFLEADPSWKNAVVSNQSEAATYLTFDRVGFGYTEASPVLHEISFAVQKGETLALVGPTGCGKTTILSLLMRYYEPTSGSIQYEGKDYRSLSQVEWRQHLGLVLQDPYLFSGTIYENLSLNRSDRNEEQAIDALKRLGGATFLNKLPQGIHTPIRQGGNEFSSGERQLLSFARALLQDPDILLLDEATSHIDTETEGIIQRGIETLRQNRTLILVAHRLSTIRHADQILVLTDGNIVESGTHETLMDRNGKYAEYVRTSQNGFFNESQGEPLDPIVKTQPPLYNEPNN